MRDVRFQRRQPGQDMGRRVADRELIGRGVGVGEFADRRRVAGQLRHRRAHIGVVGDRDRLNVGVAERVEPDEMLAAISEIAKPPTILSSAAWSAENVETLTLTGPPVAVIEAICATFVSSVASPASTVAAVSEIAS